MSVQWSRLRLGVCRQPTERRGAERFKKNWGRATIITFSFAFLFFFFFPITFSCVFLKHHPSDFLVISAQWMCYGCKDSIELIIEFGSRLPILCSLLLTDEPRFSFFFPSTSYFIYLLFRLTSLFFPPPEAPLLLMLLLFLSLLLLLLIIIIIIILMRTTQHTIHLTYIYIYIISHPHAFLLLALDSII